MADTLLLLIAAIAAVAFVFGWQVLGRVAENWDEARPPARGPALAAAGACVLVLLTSGATLLSVLVAFMGGGR